MCFFTVFSFWFRVKKSWNDVKWCGETIQFCECWGLILFGETLDGKLLLLLLSNFSGNSIMLFGVRTMRFCFFGQNVGSNFFGGKFCFPPKFFVLRYWLNMWKMLLGRLLFLKERERETLIWLSFFESWTNLLYTLLPRFFAKPKKWRRKLYFSRFLNLATFVF